MAKFTGKVSQLDMMASNGTDVAVTWACYVKESISFDWAAETVEVTSLCQDEKEFIVGLREGKASFTLMHEDGTFSSSVQKTLEDVYFGNTTRIWKLRTQGTAVDSPELSFSGFITSYKLSISNNEALAAEVELQITGDLTRGVQS